MTLFTVTIPTFWLYEATGRPPKKAPITLMIPWPMIPPDSSLFVGRRSMPPRVVEDRSPMVWTELTIYMMAMETQAAGMNWISKWPGSGAWNQPAVWTLSKLTIPIGSATK